MRKAEQVGNALLGTDPDALDCSDRLPVGCDRCGLWSTEPDAVSWNGPEDTGVFALCAGCAKVCAGYAPGSFYFTRPRG